MPAMLTRRDLEILEALTKRVRVFTLSQIARTWWNTSADSDSVAGSRLQRLATENLIHLERASAHPELALEIPVATWKPGDCEPNFGAISYRLQSRWSSHPVLTACVSASKLAATRFGGFGGRPPREVERTHDIHLSHVYLRYRLEHPELLSTWVYEEETKFERRLSEGKPKFGEKLPDVFLRAGADVRVVEFGGAYGKDKLAAFHGYCKERQYPYEIW